MERILAGIIGVAMTAFLGSPNIAPKPVVAEIQTVQIEQKSDLEVLAESLDGKQGGECVAFIQTLLGSFYEDTGFRGYAGDIEPNGTIPEVGEAVLTNAGIGHTALIIRIEGDELILLESNRKKDGVIEYGRRLKTNSPIIRGYYKFKTHYGENQKGV